MSAPQEEKQSSQEPGLIRKAAQVFGKIAETVTPGTVTPTGETCEIPRSEEGRSGGVGLMAAVQQEAEKENVSQTTQSVLESSENLRKDTQKLAERVQEAAQPKPQEAQKEGDDEGENHLTAMRENLLSAAQCISGKPQHTAAFLKERATALAMALFKDTATRQWLMDFLSVTQSAIWTREVFGQKATRPIQFAGAPPPQSKTDVEDPKKVEKLGEEAKPLEEQIQITKGLRKEREETEQEAPEIKVPREHTGEYPAPNPLHTVIAPDPRKQRGEAVIVLPQQAPSPSDEKDIFGQLAKFLAKVPKEFKDFEEIFSREEGDKKVEAGFGDYLRAAVEHGVAFLEALFPGLQLQGMLQNFSHMQQKAVGNKDLQESAHKLLQSVNADNPDENTIKDCLTQVKDQVENAQVGHFLGALVQDAAYVLDTVQKDPDAVNLSEDFQKSLTNAFDKEQTTMPKPELIEDAKKIIPGVLKRMQKVRLQDWAYEDDEYVVNLKDVCLDITQLAPKQIKVSYIYQALPEEEPQVIEEGKENPKETNNIRLHVY